MMEKQCGNCKWFDDFEGLCFNYESENCADFVSKNDSCAFWEKKEE